MGKRRSIINKKIFKQSVGRCLICGETNTSLLDVHRIDPASLGGKYTRPNSVPACCRCHRLIHDGKIFVDRYYDTTAGRKLRIIDNGVERFV